MNLSSNFTLDELVFSQIALRKGIDNTPNAEQIGNLQRLCTTLLEPVRTLLGVPLHVDSGFRCGMLNTLVGSTAPHSAHLDGLAADVVPKGMQLQTAFDLIRAGSLPFDQIIVECGAWLHLSIAQEGDAVRRQAMMASGGPGRWVYNYA